MHAHDRFLPEWFKRIWLCQITLLRFQRFVAWGHGEESWSIEYHVLWGDPLQADVWDELEELLSSTWLHEPGAQMTLTAACVWTRRAMLLPATTSCTSTAAT